MFPIEPHDCGMIFFFILAVCFFLYIGVITLITPIVLVFCLISSFFIWSLLCM